MDRPDDLLQEFLRLSRRRSNDLADTLKAIYLSTNPQHYRDMRSSLPLGDPKIVLTGDSKRNGLNGNDAWRHHFGICPSRVSISL